MSNNPFTEIETRLDRIERLLSRKESKTEESRIVNMDQFCKHIGMAKQTLYGKLSRGEIVPGAFKTDTFGRWYFNLATWDKYLEEKQQKYAETDL